MYDYNRECGWFCKFRKGGFESTIQAITCEAPPYWSTETKKVIDFPLPECRSFGQRRQGRLQLNIWKQSALVIVK